MTQIATGQDLSPEVLELLHRWGLPKHLISATIQIDAGEPVEITATFHPELPDGALAFGSTYALRQLTETWQLTRRET